MAKRPRPPDIRNLLDAISAEEPAHLQPGGQETGWDAMSDIEKRFETQKKEQLIRERDEEIRQLSDIHELRRKYLAFSFLFVAMFSAASVCIVAQCGADALDLSDAVLITLLSTTMANVIGVLCIAFKWLFPRK